MPIRRALLVALALGATAHAGEAFAHTQVQRATPGPGETVEGAVDGIELVFLDPVNPGVEIVVTDDGAPVPAGGSTELDATRRVATLDLEPIEAAGPYVVEYTYVALDGARQEGSYQFRIVAATPVHGEHGAGVAGAAAFAAMAVGAVAVAGRRRSIAEAEAA